MQFAKDSFYITLRDRLAAINPARTVTLNGVTRPAIVVAENETVLPVTPQPDTFYLEWGGAQPLPQQLGDHAIFCLECVVSYHTLGTTESGVDRGRALASLDTDLLHICLPAFATKRDYTQSPAADLGTSIVWGTPQFGKVAGSEGPKHQALPRGTSGIRLERTAVVKVFFFPEADF